MINQVSQVNPYSNTVYAPTNTYRTYDTISNVSNLSTTDWRTDAGERLARLDAAISRLEKAVAVKFDNPETLKGIEKPTTTAIGGPAPQVTPVVNPAPQAQATQSDVPQGGVAGVTEADLKWALALEERVNKQGYKASANEEARYNAIAQKLYAASKNMPTTQQAPVDPKNLKQVTMMEAQWAMELEKNVKEKGYKPSEEDIAKYQDIVIRYKANPKIKVSLYDAIASQAPGVGASVASMTYDKAIANSFTEMKTAGIGAGLKSFGSTMLKGTGLAAVVSAGFSAVTNLIGVLTGKIKGPEAAGRVAADTVNGAVTGIGATLASGAAMAGLAALGVVGWPLTLIVGGVGLLGAFLCDKLFKKSGAWNWIKEKVQGLFGKKKTHAVT